MVDRIALEESIIEGHAPLLWAPQFATQINVWLYLTATVRRGAARRPVAKCDILFGLHAVDTTIYTCVAHLLCIKEERERAIEGACVFERPH